MNLRILIADDHPVLREGVVGLLRASPGIDVVGVVSTGSEAVRAARELAPDVAVLDISMPELNGIEAALLIKERMPRTGIVFFSMHSSREHVARAFATGALGYVLKHAAATELLSAIQSVSMGRPYVSTGLELPEPAPRSFASPLDSLSSRERQVLQLVVEGKSSAEIARSVHLSPKTVETYRSRLMKKLGVADVTALVKFAVLHGVTGLD